MKIALCLGMIILAAGQLRAQTAGCPFYDRFVKEARDYAKQRKYDSAQLELDNALHCSPDKRNEIAQISREITAQKEAPADPARSTGAGANGKVVPGRVQNAQNVLSGGDASKSAANASPAAAGEKGKAVNDPGLISALSESDPKLRRQLSRADSSALMADIVRLSKTHETATIDSLQAFFRFLYKAMTYDTTYWNCVKVNAKVNDTTGFPADRKAPFYVFSLRLMDYFYFEGLLDLDYALRMLPAGFVEKYRPKVTDVRREMDARRTQSLKDYQLADTIKGLPGTTLFARQTADNRNFAWGYSDYNDYKKLKVRYFNLSLPDFSLATDSVQDLADTGLFYNISAVAGNYKVLIGREIDYSLKPSKVEYRHIAYSDAGVKKLLDSAGKAVMDLTAYSTNDFFFSPDGGHFATWNAASELLVTDVARASVVRLPHNQPALTESFSSDSKRIAYYNMDNQVIYIADLASGRVLQEIPGRETGIDSISNIDFTGGDRYLKVNNDDTLTLFDIASRRVVHGFSKALVSELVVSPDGQRFLFTCHIEYTDGSKDYKESTGIVTDTALKVKARLYSDCTSFFFSPDGDYIIGYSQFSIMRWPVRAEHREPLTASCLSLEEMVRYKCLPLGWWRSVTDADLMETGARAFKDLGEQDPDPRVRLLYYQLSTDLFHDLASGNSKNTRWERVPFFDDWYNWVRRRMGYRDFGNQFVQEFNGVSEFESYVNSPDSVYPQQLYYAAYGERLLAGLYDSMRIYNVQLIDLVEKEIDLRCRVFAKDTENITNNEYLASAFRSLDAICDSVGWRDLLNGHYARRFAVYGGEVRLLMRHFSELPDSFGLKRVFINALAQYGASFLYVYASKTARGGVRLLDSALFYAGKGLALSPDRFDSARLLLVEARAYLLEPDGLEKSMALYRLVVHNFPEFTKQSMLTQLGYLREAGERRNPALQRVEEYLHAEERGGEPVKKEDK